MAAPNNPKRPFADLNDAETPESKRPKPSTPLTTTPRLFDFCRPPPTQNLFGGGSASTQNPFITPFSQATTLQSTSNVHDPGSSSGFLFSGIPVDKKHPAPVAFQANVFVGNETAKSVDVRIAEAVEETAKGYREKLEKFRDQAKAQNLKQNDRIKNSEAALEAANAERAKVATELETIKEDLSQARSENAGLCGFALEDAAEDLLAHTNAFNAKVQRLVKENAGLKCSVAMVTQKLTAIEAARELEVGASAEHERLKAAYDEQIKTIAQMRELMGKL